MPEDTLDARLTTAAEAVMAVMNPLLDRREAAIKQLLEQNRVLTAERDEAARLSHDYRTCHESLRARIAGMADAWRLQQTQNINTGTVVETIDSILEDHRV